MSKRSSWLVGSSGALVLSLLLAVSAVGEAVSLHKSLYQGFEGRAATAAGGTADLYYNDYGYGETVVQLAETKQMYCRYIG